MQVKSCHLRLEESKDLNQSLEAKIQKMRTQFEMERDEYMKLIDNLKKKRKEKIKQFKHLINE